MNRQQRREFNRRNKTNLTRQDFLGMELMHQLKQGNIDVNDGAMLSKFSEVINIDNVEDAPDGTQVKLFYDNIKKRPQNALTKEYREFIEKHKDKVMHITREKASNSLVCLKEDISEVEDYVPFLWSIYDDFLYKDEATQEWIILADLVARKQTKTKKQNN